MIKTGGGVPEQHFMYTKALHLFFFFYEKHNFKLMCTESFLLYNSIQTILPMKYTSNFKLCLFLSETVDGRWTWVHHNLSLSALGSGERISIACRIFPAHLSRIVYAIQQRQSYMLLKLYKQINELIIIDKRR